MEGRLAVVPAVYIVLRKEGEILLLQRGTNSSYMGGFFSLPAGHLDGGESAKQAAIREAKEEVGIDIPVGDLKLAHVMHRIATEGDHERIDFFFTTDNWQGEITNTEPDKCEGLAWTPIANLPENTVPEVRFALAQIAMGAVYSDYNFS